MKEPSLGGPQRRGGVAAVDTPGDSRSCGHPRAWREEERTGRQEPRPGGRTPGSSHQCTGSTLHTHGHGQNGSKRGAGSPSGASAARTPKQLEARSWPSGYRERGGRRWETPPSHLCAFLMNTDDASEGVRAPYFCPCWGGAIPRPGQ